MKQKFKEKCDKCKERTYFYQGYSDGKIYCDKCAKKMGLLIGDLEEEEVLLEKPKSKRRRKKKQ